MSGDEKRPGRPSQRPIEAPVLPDGSRRAFKMAMYRLYLGAGQPRLDDVAAELENLAVTLAGALYPGDEDGEAQVDELLGAPAVGRDLVRAIIGGSALPGSADDAAAVAAALARMGGRLSARSDTRELAPLLRQVRELWTAAKILPPVAPVSDGDPPGHPSEQEHEPVARPAPLWNPADLDVHEALTVDDLSLPELPAYFRRAFDEDLDRALVAATDTGGLVVLTGDSSTGKTRALYEAACRSPRLSGWPMHYPRTTELLVELLGSGHLSAGAVLWLNDAQQYLEDPAGERAAAQLRELFDGSRPGPVVVLASMWPEGWTTVTAPPDHGSRDRHGQARLLLTSGRTRRIRVPEAFSHAELAALTDDGRPRADLRLVRAAATAGAGRRVIQTLAGGPQLVDRYEHPETDRAKLARALLTAAIDGKRLGIAAAVTGQWLAAAAADYLDVDAFDGLLPAAWATTGLAAAAGKVHGVRALSRRREPPPDGATVVFELHDYLEQHGRERRRDEVPPDSFWRAAARYVRRVEDRRTLAEAAEHRGRYRPAATLLAGLARDGDRESAARLARLLQKCDRVDEAHSWWRVAAEAGDAAAMVAVGAHLERHGDAADAVRWWTAAAAAGDQEAPCRIAYHLHRAGRKDEARGWWRSAAEVNGGEDYYADRTVMDLLLREGRSDEAAVWAPRRMSYSGGATRWDALARLLHRQGRTADAIAWWDKYLEVKDHDDGDYDEVLREATTTRIEAGRVDETIAWLRAAADRGNQHALHEFVARLTELGRVDEAVRWLTGYAATRANVVNDRTAEWIADLLVADGRGTEALASLRRAAVAGDDAALVGAVAMMQAAGHSREALDWLAGDFAATASAERARVMCLMVRLLRAAGHRSLALLMLQEAVELGSGLGGHVLWNGHRATEGDEVTPARALQEWDEAYSHLDVYRLVQAVSLLQFTGAHHELVRRGERTGAEDLTEEQDARQVAEWLRAKRSPGEWRSRAAVRLAERSGFAEEALAAHRRLGDPHAQLRLLETMGRVDEAVRLLLDINGGAEDFFVRTRIAGLLHRTRGVDEAVAFLLEERDHHSVARLYIEAGRRRDAVTAWRQSADGGNPYAVDQVVALLRQEGHADRANQLHRYGWESDGTVAVPWAVPEPPDTA